MYYVILKNGFSTFIYTRRSNGRSAASYASEKQALAAAEKIMTGLDGDRYASASVVKYVSGLKRVITVAPARKSPKKKKKEK